MKYIIKLIKIGLFVFVLLGMVFLSRNSSSALSENKLDEFAQNNILFYDPSSSRSSIRNGGDDYLCSGQYNIEGSTPEEKYWNILNQYEGIDEIHAAAIMGSLSSEGLYNPVLWEWSHMTKNYGGVWKSANWDRLYNCGNGTCPFGVGSFGITYNLGTYLKFVNEKAPDLLKYFQETEKYSIETNKIIEAIGEEDFDRLISIEVQYKLGVEEKNRLQRFLEKTTLEEATDWWTSVAENCNNCCGTADKNKVCSSIADRRAKAKAIYDKYTSGGASSSSSSSSSTVTCSDDYYYDGDGGVSGESIAETAVLMSWPVQKGQGDDEHIGMCQKSDGTWVKFDLGSKTCYDNPRALYKQALDKYKIDAGTNYNGKECSELVAAVLRYLGLVDDSYPSHAYAGNYFLNHPDDWEQIENIGSVSNLKPGDIMVQRGAHILIYVGDYGGSYGSLAHASLEEWVGRITTNYLKVVDGKYKLNTNVSNETLIFRHKSSAGSLTKGLTARQILKLAYHYNAENEIGCGRLSGGRCDNCSAVSDYFVRMFLENGSEVAKKVGSQSGGMNGGAFAKNLANALGTTVSDTYNGGYAIFSCTRSGACSAANGWKGCGHTGLVLGKSDDGKWLAMDAGYTSYFARLWGTSVAGVSTSKSTNQNLNPPAVNSSNFRNWIYSGDCSSGASFVDVTKYINSSGWAKLKLIVGN